MDPGGGVVENMMKYDGFVKGGGMRDDDDDFIRGGEGYKKMMMMNSQTTLVFCHRKLISKIKWLQISKVP